MYTFFQVTQPGIEPGHPRTLYPDDVIRNTIRNVGHPIYVVNEVFFRGCHRQPLILFSFADYVVRLHVTERYIYRYIYISIYIIRVHTQLL